MLGKEFDKLGEDDRVAWEGIQATPVFAIRDAVAAAGKFPLVIYHPGLGGTYEDNLVACEFLASRGYVVLAVNYRGGTGYGLNFRVPANFGPSGASEFNDILGAANFLKARADVDPKRLGVWGGSYGGYMTAWTLTQTNRFKAVVVGAGLTDMFSMYSTDDLQRLLVAYFGAEPWNDVEAYRRASAMTFIKQAKTPTLILHGGSDLRVPPSQAQELYMGLRQNGVPVEMVVFPREPHGLQEPRHRLDKMRREYSWCSKYVLGVEVPEPAPASNDKPKPDEKPSK